MATVTLIQMLPQKHCHVFSSSFLVCFVTYFNPFVTLAVISKQLALTPVVYFPVSPAEALWQSAVLHGATAFFLVDAGRKLQLLTAPQRGGRGMCVLLPWRAD